MSTVDITGILQDEARAEVERLRTAIVACRNRFAHYAELHRLKGTAEGLRKAEENQAMVNLCDAALGRKARP